jgi:hypothetical protein
MLECTTGGGGAQGWRPRRALMSEKEAWEQAGQLREANRVSGASAARAHHIGAKAQGILRGILHGSKKASPNA